MWYYTSSKHNKQLPLHQHQQAWHQQFWDLKQNTFPQFS